MKTLNKNRCSHSSNLSLSYQQVHVSKLLAINYQTSYSTRLRLWAS